MAEDNGHCSTCQYRNTAKSCGSSVQSFKNILGSKVSDNESYIKVNSTFSSITQNATLISASIFNHIKTILGYVKNYGEAGTRNPTADAINAITNRSSEATINLNAYNDLLTILGKNNKTGNPYITKALMDDINQFIKDYQLNDNRCNICNTACQNCQSHVPDCNCDCNCNCNCNTDCRRTNCPPACFNGECARTNCPAACFNGSKKELKENIHIFTQYALDIINQVKIIDFNYIDDIEKNYKVGFIADDTNEILATKNHDQMDMYNCIGLLLKAVQELSEEVNKLKEK